MPLILKSLAVDEELVLELAGRIDSLTAPELHAAVSEAVAGGAAAITLDLRAVEYISSAGLRTLLRSLKLARRRGGALHLAAAQPQVAKLLAVSGFTELFAGQDV